MDIFIYTQRTSRPDISVATHQAVRFCINPKFCYERAIHIIGRYLKRTKDKGVIFKQYTNKGLECYADVDFAGGWDNANSGNPE